MCELSELDPAHCACRRHRGGSSPTEKAAAERTYERAAFPARYAGHCVECNGPIEVGAMILLEGSSGYARGFAHEGCTE